MRVHVLDVNTDLVAKIFLLWQSKVEVALFVIFRIILLSKKMYKNINWGKENRYSL